MGLRQCIQRIVFYASIFSIDFFVLALKLLPVSIDEWEGSDVVLKCSDNQIPLANVRWVCNTKVAVVYNSSGTCGTFAGFLQDYPHLFSYSCTDGTGFTLTLKKLSRQNHSDACYCEITEPGKDVMSNRVTIRVKVPVESTFLNYTKEELSILENSVTSIQCYSSDCRPIPAFKWYIDRNTESVADDILLATNENKILDDTLIQSSRVVFNIQPNRTLNNWYLFCGGINRNDDTVLSRKIFLNILYSPDGPPIIRSYTNGTEIKVIQNMVLQLECVSTGGNPLPNLQWNKESRTQQNIFNNTVTKSLIWRATGVTKVELRCYFIYNLMTYMTFIIAELLYPPEAIDVSLIIDTDNTSSIEHNFSVIENTSNTILLICSARSNPSPNSYRWTGPIQSNSSRLEIIIARHVRGTYTCHVNNTMIAHDGRREQGYNSVPYIVNILQSPDIGRLEDANVVEGNNVSITCPIINGNDTWRSVTWLNKHSVQVGQNENLLIKNVARIANGTYTCQLNFTLQPTYGTQRIKTITKGFDLNVFYQAEILSLSINNEVNSLTVNESARVHFVCKVDSNPNSSVEIKFNNKIRSTKSNTRTLEYLIPSVNCYDTGTYVCTGNNTYNTGQRATLDNKLLVLCSPRQSPSFELKQNVTSALNESATFQFTALAYPTPRVQWYRVMNGSETSENHTGVITSHNISTTEMQTTFTLDNVEVIQYGEYLLKVENQYGTYSQPFFLVAEGKPTPPTYYGLFPDSVTSNSVTIWWEPGYDGGLPQSFIISYNLTALKWYNGSAISHNKERRLNNTITELASSSVYHVLIYAQNEKGAVRVPHAIIVNTKESTETLAKHRSVGPAVGGTVGGLLAVISVTVSLIIVRKRKIGKRARAQHKASDLTDLHTYQNFQNDDHSPSEGSSSAVYERLQHADSKSDQQYQQLATFSEKDKIDAPNQRVYENLKLSQQNKETNVGSSGSCQNTSAHNQGPD